MPRLSPFLLLSLAMHAAVLLPIVIGTPVLSGQRDNVLSVTLRGPDFTVPAPALLSYLPKDNIHAGKTDATTKDDAIPIPVKPHNTVGENHETPEAGNTIAAQSEADGETAADAGARIRAHVITDLKRHFDYPELARRRGWEGEVQLAFQVASDGYLRELRVARSSGYGLLDDSALESLRRVVRITETATWLHGDRLDLQIPVIYRLQGNR